MSDVVIYGRPGCHLCEDAMAVIERVHAEIPFNLEVIDIEGDDTLLMRYLERIPVVVVGGEERFQFFVGEREFRDAVGNLSRSVNRPPDSL